VRDLTQHFVTLIPPPSFHKRPEYIVCFTNWVLVLRLRGHELHCIPAGGAIFSSGDGLTAVITDIRRQKLPQNHVIQLQYRQSDSETPFSNNEV
jgi:hypothetical protein